MKSWMKLALVAGMALVVSVTAVSAAQVLVGDFLVQVARAKNIAAADAVSAERGLRAAGINLPRLDFGKALTEGDVVNIANAVGVQVTTTRPTTPFTQTQVDSFLLTFGSDLGGLPKEPNPSPNNGRGTTKPDPQPGKGLSKGHYKSPSEPI